ncbi:glycosyltransferase [Bosea sp. (in: a-proteobacteria)]|uniref:glycosyltransferase n=1 Tax=Bosea sp. (in: a-proteobacteria) TaxID=1871050 RepID=UPI0012150882|nr:glycosyltransferase [Bosea sp. (in: a-proteobacteria)]TAJ32727.1 MAG: glycosyltransferase [Bosea sp. (in: a-proteobacteria)]
MTRIALVSVSPLQHDSRVLRHATLLVDTGYDVRIFAQAPLPASPPAPVTVVPGPGSDTRVRLGMVLRQAPASVVPASADLLYWLSPSRLTTRRDLLSFKPDLVIANDWRALPLAFAAKHSCGARIIYDSHEFAPEEFADSWRWRVLARHHVVRIEDRYIREADAVATVSDGIADALAQRYGLTRPTVISNTPAWQETAFRPTVRPVTVLYHGAVVPRRGLETLIESVSLWPAEFRLVIRGPAQGGFQQHLRNLAAPFGERVTLEPAVPPDQVVTTASRADIGIFLLSNSTVHARFALPNKIFEYLAAGLMVISSDLPEIRKILQATGSGLLLPDFTAEAIAGTLSRLTAKEIDSCKRRSSTASTVYSFTTEGAKLLRLVEQLRYSRIRSGAP